MFFRTIPDLYAKKVVEDGVMSEREVEEIVKGHNEWLNRQLKRVDSYKPLVIIFCCCVGNNRYELRKFHFSESLLREKVEKFYSGNGKSNNMGYRSFNRSPQVHR